MRIGWRNQEQSLYCPEITVKNSINEPRQENKRKVFFEKKQWQKKKFAQKRPKDQEVQRDSSTYPVPKEESKAIPRAGCCNKETNPAQAETDAIGKPGYKMETNQLKRNVSR